MTEIVEFAKMNPFITLLIVIVIVNGIVSIVRVVMSNPTTDEDGEQEKKNRN